MKGKRLIIWVIFLGIAAALFFLSEQVDKRHHEAEQEDTKLLTLSDPLNIQSIELSGKDIPKTILIERRDEEHQWVLVKPVKYPADGMQIGRMLSALLEGKVERRLEEPGDLKQFGLEPPSIKVVLTDKNGDKDELLVGELSPTKNYVYASPAGSNEVLLLKPTTRGAVNRTLVELRDKTCLNLVIAKVDSLALQDGKEPIELKRTKGGAEPEWRFADGGQADTSVVEDALLVINGLMAKDFVDQGIDLEKMGLAHPAGSAVITQDGTKKGLILGGKVPGRDERYVRRLDGGPVMVVGSRSLDRLKEFTPFKLSQRRLMKFKRDEAVALEVKRGGKVLKYEKDQGRWKRTQPAGDKKSGDAASLLVWDLGELKWQKILGTGGLEGLDKPQAVINLYLKRPAKEKAGDATVTKKVLTLGSLDEKSGLIRSRVSGDDRIFGLAADFIKNLPQAGEQQKKAK